MRATYAERKGGRRRACGGGDNTGGGGGNRGRGKKIKETELLKKIESTRRYRDTKKIR